MTETDPREGYHTLVRTDVFPLVPDRAGRVLDVGGGVGATSAALKRDGRASHVTLIDLVAEDYDPAVDAAYSGDLEDPALLERAIAETGPFDTVLCLDVLEHLRDPWQVVATVHKGLAPGGRLIASIPNVRNIALVWPLVMQGRFDLDDSGILDRTHLRWFTRSSAIALMGSSGLEIERVIDKLRAGRRYSLANAATLGLFRRFLEIQYLISARRPERETGQETDQETGQP